MGDGKRAVKVRSAAKRQAFILTMARLAREEPAELLGTEPDLVARTLQYAATARPRVTRREVENVLREEAGLT